MPAYRAVRARYRRSGEHGCIRLGRPATGLHRQRPHHPLRRLHSACAFERPRGSL